MDKNNNNNCNNDNQFAIISIISLLIIFLTNYFLFNLKFILSLLYDIIIFIFLYFHIKKNDDKNFGNLKEKISIALMSESVIISFQDFYKQKRWYEFWTSDKVSISPNMLTLIVTMLYALSIHFRNNIKLLDFEAPKSYITHILNILFFSSLISVLMSNNYFYIPFIGETSYTSQSFCLFLLVLSWAGMKSLNIFIFPCLAILSLGRIGEVNKAMGITGIFYLLFSYTSILLQIDNNDNNEIYKIYQKSFYEFSNDFRFKEKIKKDDKDPMYKPLIDKNNKFIIN